ncbi:ESX-2 secretion-associated protein EspG2 [Mycobacterium kubicae]|uniref:ESX secretion-associated protein EspG n=1 Tax=Mycobacterium kubicae TaxID=120959 RepID=A0AAX1JBW9_9MYCO|nr:ESX secretion-associated protein EspG [Mycobacterium kubicae]MCV7094892.1 ESX secretion-associated protein EspG [Mycobacterium kubicae]ORW02807.1 secretion protein EspG [Mycobacterium kubicae]QNI09157.1 ESX secretion-associated protein EspG [Mycobacterium kubicae]QNI14480.1 ESX secretion-associated protein EspG [Mycobacterium kubicae]QPI38005.1 ESX secretion-associated protein EspG [Mycobacterium kubicae]
MLTTTVDGLWALQVLTGIETLAPELGLRPLLPSVEPKQLALHHPVTSELRAAGVIDESDAVDTTVVEWLTVLHRRDVALFMQIRRPGDDEPARVLLARFAQWWVALERHEELIRLSAAGTATAEVAASTVVTAQIDRLCGQNTPARLRPVTLEADALRAAAVSRDGVSTFLSDQRLEPEQLRTLSLAADPAQSAQASIVAIQSGVATGQSGRTYIDGGAVTIIDTPEGRLVAEGVQSSGKNWMIVAPGTKTHICAAINQMMRRLPAENDWHSYRKVV